MAPIHFISDHNRTLCGVRITFRQHTTDEVGAMTCPKCSAAINRAAKATGGAS